MITFLTETKDMIILNGGICSGQTRQQFNREQMSRFLNSKKKIGETRSPYLPMHPQSPQTMRSHLRFKSYTSNSPNKIQTYANSTRFNYIYSSNIQKKQSLSPQSQFRKRNYRHSRGTTCNPQEVIQINSEQLWAESQGSDQQEQKKKLIQQQINSVLFLKGRAIRILEQILKPKLQARSSHQLFFHKVKLIYQSQKNLLKQLRLSQLWKKQLCCLIELMMSKVKRDWWRSLRSVERYKVQGTET